MYRLMVVDDEPIVRLALKSLINWEENGFSFEYEAANGKQAFQVCHKCRDIDVVITDINMPVMDGLELIGKLKTIESPPEILVLSAYNDYELVRKAFKMGARDYILKTEMDPQSVLNVLKPLVEYIEEKRAPFAAVNTARAGNNYKHLKERLLQDLINGDDLANVEVRIADLDLKIRAQNLIVCFLIVDDYQVIEEKYGDHSLNTFVKSINGAIDQILSDYNSGEVFTVSPSEYVVLLSFQDNSIKQIRNRLLQILGRVKHALKNYLNVDVTTGVSELGYGLSYIYKLSKEAETNAKLRFTHGKGRIR